MPRPPSVRRPTLEAMKKNVERINRRMDADPERLLTEEERTALVDAAKVGRLLEMLKADDSEDEKDETKPPEEVAEVARRMEEKTPAKVTRGAPDSEHDE